MLLDALPLDAVAAVAAALPPRDLQSFAAAAPSVLAAPSPSFPTGVVDAVAQGALAVLGAEAR